MKSKDLLRKLEKYAKQHCLMYRKRQGKTSHLIFTLFREGRAHIGVIPVGNNELSKQVVAQICQRLRLRTTDLV